MVIAIFVGSVMALSFSGPASPGRSTYLSLASSPAFGVPFSAPTSYPPPPINRVLFPASTSTTSGTADMLATPSTGVIVPLFTEDSGARLSEVNEIIQVKLAYPAVPMIVIINPDGGPGYLADSTIRAEVMDMQAAGIVVIGYVPTGWASGSISSVESEMLTYLSWYGVNGIYLDQMPNWNYNSPSGSWYYGGPDGEFVPAYFATLDQYGKSIGMTEVMANSGADVPTDFIGSADTIGTFENGYLPSLSLTAGWNSIAGVGGWHTGYNKSNFMFFSYAVPSLDPMYVLAASDYVGYLYITNGTGSQPYNALSPYLDQIASLLASKDAATIPVTVQSATLNGTPTSGGLWVTVTQDGSSISGFTPSTFEVDSGSVVTISADNYDSYFFDHWSGGSTSPTTEVTPIQSTTLVAYYRYVPAAG
jgi:spherulation-specific family 4 protein